MVVILCKGGVRLFIIFDFSFLRYISLWSVDVLFEVDLGLGQEVTFGGAGVADRFR